MDRVLEELQTLCKNTLVEHLGIEFIAFDGEKLTAKMPISSQTCRPDGCLHGGANLALAETIGGALSALSVDRNLANAVFGIEISGNHIKQAKGTYVTAVGEFRHKGKRTHVVDVEVADEFGTVVTISRVTNMIAE